MLSKGVLLTDNQPPTKVTNTLFVCLPELILEIKKEIF